MSDLLALTGDQPIMKTDEKALMGLSGGGSFLPRLQACTSTSKVAQAGKIGVGKLAIVQGEEVVHDLGTEVDLVVFAARAMAGDTNNGNKFYYDQESPEFKRIIAESGEKDSGMFYGPEFLVYIPSIRKFVTAGFVSISARIEAASVFDLMKEAGGGSLKATAATFRSKLCVTKDKKRSWHVMQALACTTGVSVLPEKAELDAVLQTFLNPKSSNEETLPAEDTDRAR